MNAFHNGLQALSTTEAVALVGVADGSFYGQLFIKNLVNGGFRGKIAPVHHRAGMVAGHPAYASINDIPHSVDVAVLLLKANRCAQAARELADKGCRCLLVMADGFIESGTDEGRRAQEELVEVCDQRGILLIGPNGVGAADYRAGLVCLGVPLNEPGKSGGASIFSQSGALLSGMIDGFLKEGVGLDLALSVGNGAQFGIADALEALVERESTTFIAGYVEGFGSDLSRIRNALRRARAADKMVVLVKGGRSELSIAVAASHTASIAGSDRLISAMLRSVGVHRVDEPEEMIRLISIASKLPAPHAISIRGGVAVATASGGNAGILADLASQYKVRLADFQERTWSILRAEVPDSGFVGNPLDVTGRGAAGGLDVAPIYEAIFGDPNVDMLVYGFGPPWPDDDPGREAHRATFRLVGETARRHGKPVVVPTTTSQRATGWVREFTAENPHVLFIEGQQLTMKVLGRLFPAGSLEPPGNGTSVDRDVPDERQSRLVLSETRGRTLLASAGIPLARGIDLTSATPETLDAALDGHLADLAPPYVLKARVEGLSHKAAVGAVAVGLPDRAAIVARAKDMVGSIAEHRPDLRVDGFLVQEMVRGTELLLGLVRYPDIGATMTLGLGGALSETTDHNATVSLEEVCDDWVDDLVELAGLTRLMARLSPAARASFGDVLVRARNAFLTGTLDNYQTVEINPLFMTSEGPPLAGDALVISDHEDLG